MSDDYLWDRGGKPEPDVLRLEQLLGQLRWSKAAMDADPRRLKATLTPSRRRWWAMAAATAVVLGLGATLFELKMNRPPVPTSWQLSFSGGQAQAVHAGQLIETGKTGRGTMQSALTGQVKIEPGSRLRLLRASASEQRLALDHGTIHALIWAPPTRFVVDTPAGKTIDLGCQYTLSVAENGGGVLTVETGWVAFQWRHLESFIPAGASCTTRPGHGPDTPHFLDAPEALVKAVSEFDMTGNTAVLATGLSAARPRDALTLWHLLQRTHGAVRAKVLDRFGMLVNLPLDLTREQILNGDQKSMDAAWDALRLGETTWWREWKREW